MQALKNAKTSGKNSRRTHRNSGNITFPILNLAQLKESMAATVAFFNSDKETLTQTVDKDLQDLQADFLNNSQKRKDDLDRSEGEESESLSSPSRLKENDIRSSSSSSLNIEAQRKDTNIDDDSSPSSATDSDSEVVLKDCFASVEVISKRKRRRHKLLASAMSFGDIEPVHIENAEDVNLLQPDWWRCTLANSEASHLPSIDDLAFLQLGPKIEFALKVLALAHVAGEKVLLFSQSLNTLDILSLFLENDWGQLVGMDANSETRLRGWRRGREFLRIDGSVEKRKELIDKFENDPSCRLFILSTKAGNMGINLQQASRVIVMDASWNPVHDLQAIYRSYRFGQRKTVFVYRLLAAQSMEEKVNLVVVLCTICNLGLDI